MGGDVAEQGSAVDGHCLCRACRQRAAARSGASPARSWRLDDPERVYVLAADADLPSAATAVREALLDVGVDDPAVEVHWPGDGVDTYTEAARRSRALLWTAEPLSPVRLVSATAGDRIAAGEWDRVPAYLEAGIPVMSTTAGTTCLTDGTWIWTNATTADVRERDLAPEPDLLANIRAAGVLLPAADAVTMHRVLAKLFEAYAPGNP